MLLGACSRGAGSGEQSSQAAGTGAGAVVARVGKVELREDDLQRAMARDPGAAPGRFGSLDAQSELLDGLVRFELLAQAAERAGLTKDPDAIHALRQIAVTKLVNQKLGAAGSPESITKADIEREYAARQASEFTLPAAAHVRHIRVAEGKLAKSLTERAKALAPDDDAGFAKLAKAASEDAATRSSGGDLGFVDKSSRLPSAVVEAALGLNAPGDVAGPIAAEAGFEILRLVSRRAAAVSPLSSVEEPLRQQLYRDRRAKALEALIAQLRSETQVELVTPAPPGAAAAK